MSKNLYTSFSQSNINKWQVALNKLLKEYESIYIPEDYNLEQCLLLIETGYDSIRGWKKRDNADILLNSNDKKK
jgi:hypothetical protein